MDAVQGRGNQPAVLVGEPRLDQNGGLPVYRRFLAARSEWRAMVDLIDELKRKYTDKYVVVDGSRPELARFRDTYGTVKTVNMSGRALVEFANYHLNIGWYDIDPAFLKVVDTPPEPKVKEAPAKEAPAKKEAAAAKPAAKPAAGGAGKQSTADILAALRSGGGKTPAKGEGVSAGREAKPKPAATPKTSGAAPAKVDRSKMSVADMLAAARAGKSAAPAAAPAQEPAGEPASAGGDQADQVEQAAVAAAPPTPAAKAPSGPIDKKSMTIDQMIAWCKEHDTK